jgi:hypothetical protein
MRETQPDQPDAVSFRSGVEMVGNKQEHQPEPWTQDGRYILDASGWTLASTRFPADARRIVAAINAVQGIPTDALESWVVNVVGEVAGPAKTPPPGVPVERRERDRRRGDRRTARPEIRIFGSEEELLEENGETP